MYLVLYRYKSTGTEGCSVVSKRVDHELIHGWDAKDALEVFYSTHEYPSIDRAMFRTLIAKIDLAEAVALHNALIPSFYIVAIHNCDDKALYDESEGSKEANNV